MIISIDGFGGYDYHRERADRYDSRRSEALLFSDEFKVFILTAQEDPNRYDGRAAYISIRPFNTLDDETRESLRRQATEIKSSANSFDIAIIPKPDGQLAFKDNITNTESTISFAELDPEVRDRLRIGPKAAANWEKYLGVKFATVATLGADMPGKEKNTGLGKKPRLAATL